MLPMEAPSSARMEVEQMTIGTVHLSFSNLFVFVSSKLIRDFEQSIIIHGKLSSNRARCEGVIKSTLINKASNKRWPPMHVQRGSEKLMLLGLLGFVCKFSKQKLDCARIEFENTVLLTSPYRVKSGLLKG